MEAPVLEQEIWQVYRDQGLTVLGIDLQEPPILVAEWAEELGLTYTILSAPDWSLLFRFGLGSIPYNAILGPDRELHYSSAGFDLNAIRDQIVELLTGGTGTMSTNWGNVKALYGGSD